MTESAGDLPPCKTQEWDSGAVAVTFGTPTTAPDGCSFTINLATMVSRSTPCGSVLFQGTCSERSSLQGETMSNEVETGAKTLRQLAEWILGQPLEIQRLRVYNDDSEYGKEPWHGVIEIHDEERRPMSEGVYEVHEAHAVISDALTQAEHQKVQEMQNVRDSAWRREHWNRPEVQEAKRQGLLP